MHRFPIKMRFFTNLAADIVENRQGVICERVNWSRWFIEEPQPNGGIELRLYSVFACQNYELCVAHCPFDFSLIRSIFATQWQSVTLTKKLSIKSRKSRNASRVLVRNFWSRKTYSANYARLQRPRLKSGLSTSRLHRKHCVSKRSSRPEKLVSRFFARFTLPAVSVTV